MSLVVGILFWLSLSWVLHEDMQHLSVGEFDIYNKLTLFCAYLNWFGSHLLFRFWLSLESWFNFSNIVFILILFCILTITWVLNLIRLLFVDCSKAKSWAYNFYKRSKTNSQVLELNLDLEVKSKGVAAVPG